MPLDLATFQTLAQACAPNVAPATLFAVAQTESRLNPLAIGVNGPGGGSLDIRALETAVRTAEALIAAGRNIDLGLGQINSRNLGWLGLSVEAAFDPCRNLAAAARLLQASYARANPAPGAEQAALRTALSLYNTGDPQRGLRNGYVARVVRAASRYVPALQPAGEVADAAALGRLRPRPRLVRLRLHPDPRRTSLTAATRLRRGFGLAAVLALSASPAFAQTTGVGGDLGGFIQNLIDLLNSGIIRGLAVLAVIVTGIAWMFGHLDLRRAGTVVVGIIVIFGASTIVDLITGGHGG